MGSNKKLKSNNDDINQEYIATLFLGILESDKDTVDIKCLLPDVDNKDTEEITHIAEKYAQLLVLINASAFNKNIFSILTSHKKQHKENYKTTMLIDSIISFWNILYDIENKKSHQKFKTSQPLIRPSEAFKIK